MRIHVTGNAGSGKSTLALELSKVLGIPTYSLDTVVWKAHWQKATPEERGVAECMLVAKPDWIIEGVSQVARGAAEVIIFLDYPRWLCFARCARRNVRYLFRSRPGLPDNCPEMLIIPRLTRIIWRFPREVKPLIEKDTSEKLLFRLINDQAVEEFLKSLWLKSVLPG